jgi:small subunit ribosomal protein S5
LKYGI